MGGPMPLSHFYWRKSRLDHKKKNLPVGDPLRDGLFTLFVAQQHIVLVPLSAGEKIDIASGDKSNKITRQTEAGR